jgi:hypothetical protein
VKSKFHMGIQMQAEQVWMMALDEDQVCL